MQNISVKSGFSSHVDTILCFVTEGGVIKKALPEILRSNRYILEATEGFKGEIGELRVIYMSASEVARCVLLVGVGERDKLNVSILRKAVNQGVLFAEKEGVHSLSVYVKEELLKHISAEECGYAIIETSLLCLYKFSKYKSKKDKKQIKKLTVFVENKKAAEKIASVQKIAEKTAESVMRARDLISEPSNKVTPQEFAKRMSEAAKESGVSAKVMTLAEIKKEKMGGLLAVSSGSKLDPVFLILHYKGKADKYKKKVCLIGKGVCFDSGGISLKPSANMGLMKYDMAGAAVMSNAVIAAAECGVKHEVIGLIPLCENMPDANATKPGDIIIMRNGMSVEVSNTDAEGRLILADALDYAGIYKPDIVIDAATLTGACKVCLGTKAAAVMGNDGELLEELQEKGLEVGERLWQLPLWNEYQDNLKNDIADLNNVSSKGAGTITAGKFLSNFAPKDAAWAHIDIASVAWEDEGKPGVPKGASGFGMRLLVKYLMD